jgi:hypothetical protein
MKDVLKRGVGVLIMLITCTLSASSLEPVIEVLNENEMSIRFTLDGLKKNSKILVIDQFGAVLYRETAENTNYEKVFNFEELEEGIYTMEIHNEVSIDKIPFKVAAKKVYFEKANRKKVFKPYLIKKGSIIKISKLALNFEELEVRFIDDQSRILYNETLGGKKSLGLVFNLESLESGQYTVLMKSDGMEFIKFINVD